MTKKQTIVEAGRRAAQRETVQELRDLFQPWLSLGPDFGKGAYERLSFKGTAATIRQWAPTLAKAQSQPERAAALYKLMLYYIAADPVPHRPDRIEPRAKKRRPKNYALLTKPRRIFKDIVHRNRYKKGKS